MITRHITVRLLTLMLLTSATVATFAGGSQERDSMEPDAGTAMAAIPETAETAVLAGGCFWGVEGVFERLSGVIDVKSGYAGGDAETARYDLIGRGTTGHAESVEIIYDPKVVSYEVLLDVFFTVAHDPTQLNYQGPDHGSQYRSAIFYTNDEQKRVAEDYIRDLEKSKTFRAPVVTQVVALPQFYAAEDYHQDFMERNPGHPYIVYWDLPKIDHLEREFPDLIESR